MQFVGSSTINKLGYFTETEFKELEQNMKTIGKHMYIETPSLKDMKLTTDNFIELYNSIKKMESLYKNTLSVFLSRNISEKDPSYILANAKYNYFNWLHLIFKTWVFDLYLKKYPNTPTRTWPDLPLTPPYVFAYNIEIRKQEAEELKKIYEKEQALKEEQHIKAREIIFDINGYKRELDVSLERFKQFEEEGNYYLNCLDSNIPSDLSKRPFFLFYGKPKFMINYHYLWYKFREGDITEEENKKILNIIFKYSYPSCNLYTDELREDEKEQIINNEYEFIKNKIETEFVNIKIIQIPRLIYDLYNIIYRRENYQNIKGFVCNIDNRFEATSYDAIKYLINQFNLTQIENIIMLNNNFIKLLSEKNIIEDLLKPVVLTEVYLHIFELLYDIIINPLKMKEEQEAKMESPTLLSIKAIETFEYIFNSRFKSVLFQTLLIELGFIYDIKTDKYNLNTQNNLIILYRGYAGYKFNITKDDKPHSNSFNTSIINGIVYDKTANTYNFMKPGCNKMFLLIKKHFYNDKSNEDDIFFIPPIHPFLLLYGAGEYWHARSKLYNGPSYYTEGESGLSAIPSDFIVSRLNKEELDRKFKEIINPQVLIDKYYVKYLKYKQKYMQLKSNI
jgi:hypothetical protein